MTTNKSDSGPDNSEQAESLSATGMFLRAFGESPKPDPAPEDPLKASPAKVPAQPAVQRPAAPAQTAGEFTQMFHTPEPRQPAAPVSPASGDHPGASAARTAGQPPTEQDRGAGEFTRIFVSGVTPPTAFTPKPSEEPTKASLLPAAGQPRSKGFSAPGVSGSASAEGSFTQLFNAATASRTRPSVEPPAAHNSRDSAWNNDPIFRSPQNQPPSEPPSPSVTTLLNSLGTDKGPPAGRQPEPAPYRPEPSFRTPPPVSSEPSEVSPGGVTRLIQRLAQTPPAEPAPAPAVIPASPSVSSGPGEFTRMISRMGPSSPAAEPPPPPPQAGPPAPTSFAPPPMPAIAPPPIPPAPKFAPPPAPAMPPMPIPAAPKPSAPALPAPKSKLEAMVPILLVINTFLLLILLIVVIFLIKSR
jgi:hypothetical protein